MLSTQSIMSLHLRYRLWIAELNADITVLRIFDDYIAELAQQKENTEVKNGIEQFKKQFIDMRTEIDELKHELHLIKMKLAAESKASKNAVEQPSASTNQASLNKRYAAFRESFDVLKKDFGKFEGKWLD